MYSSSDEIVQKKQVMQRWFDRIFILFFLFLPFQFALNPGEDIDLALVRLFVVGIFVFWIGLFVIRGYFFFPRSFIFWLALSFVFLCVFSFFWAENGEWALRKSVFLINFLLFFIVLSYGFLERMICVENIVRAIIFSGFFSAIFGLGQFFFSLFVGVSNAVEFWRISVAPFFLGERFSEAVVEYSSWLVNISGHTVFRAIGPFPDPHIAAFFWGMCFMMALSFALYKKTTFSFFVSGVIFLALILTFSRGVYFALSGVFFLFVLGGVFLSRKGKAILVFTGGVLLFVFLFSPTNPFFERFLSSFSSVDTSNQGRLEMWSQAGVTLWEQPWGVGIGNYALTLAPFADYRDPYYAHNIYLDVMVESGIIAGMVLIGVLVSVCWVGFLLWKKWDIWWGMGTFLSVGVFGLYGIFDTPLYSVHIFPLLLCIFAIAVYGEMILRKKK
jgi:O-antigen ligase